MQKLSIVDQIRNISFLSYRQNHKLINESYTQTQLLGIDNSPDASLANDQLGYTPQSYHNDRSFVIDGPHIDSDLLRRKGILEVTFNVGREIIRLTYDRFVNQLKELSLNRRLTRSFERDSSHQISISRASQLIRHLIIESDVEVTCTCSDHGRWQVDKAKRCQHFKSVIAQRSWWINLLVPMVLNTCYNDYNELIEIHDPTRFIKIKRKETTTNQELATTKSLLFELARKYRKYY